MTPCHVKPRVGLLLALVLLPCSALGGPPQEPFAPSPGHFLTSFTDQELKALNAGSQVVRTTAQAKSPWPRTQVWQVARVTPEQGCQGFSQYSEHRNFFPGVVKSKVEGDCGQGGTEVFYELKVPIIRNEQYRVCNETRQLAQGGCKVSWEMTWALRSKNIQGAATFEPWGSKHVLIGHENAIDPGTSMASLLKGMALKKAQETVEKLAKYLEATASLPTTPAPTAPTQPPLDFAQKPSPQDTLKSDTGVK